jgi:hypothetical protein
MLADHEVLQLALKSGIPCRMLSSVYGNVLRQNMSSMADQHSEARRTDGNVTIDHEHAMGRIGSASNLCAGWLATWQDSWIVHGVTVSRTTRSGPGGC